MTAEWSIAIFTSREEAAVLQETLQAVFDASAAHRCVIDVLVDGNPAAAAAIAAWNPTPSDAVASTLRLWLVPWNDKACTWNRYLHEIAPDASLAFFIDGYVRPLAQSLEAMEGALRATTHAWAATAVPSVGPSAASQRRRLLADGGLHGNLYALRGEYVRLLKERGFRLPTGLYRNDSLIGAVVCFGADPARERWDPKRIVAVADATWTNDVAPVFSVARLRAYLKRRLRQAQGDLENAAVRQHLAIHKRAPEQLPRSVAALLDSGPTTVVPRRGPIDRYLIARARREVANRRGPWSFDEPPRLLRVWDPY